MFVAFRSEASNLVTGDTDGAADIFVKYLGTGGKIVNASADTPYDTDSPDISGNGRGVAFVRRMVVPCGDNPDGCTALYDMIGYFNASTFASSTPSVGQPSFRTSAAPSISYDGRYVAFASTHAFVSTDTNDTWDIYRRDMQQGVTVRVSVNSSGAQPNGLSTSPSISGDGSRVAFESSATNFDGYFPDTNGGTDIIHKVVGGVSVNASLQLPGNKSAPSLSNDNHVVFVSQPSAGSQTEIYEATVNLPNLQTADCCVLHSFNYDQNITANGSSSKPAISASGKWSAFTSLATNLRPGSDTNGASDVFLHVYEPDRGHCMQVFSVVGGSNGDPPPANADNWGKYWYDEAQNQWFECRVVGYDSNGNPIYDWVPIQSPFG